MTRNLSRNSSPEKKIFIGFWIMWGLSFLLGLAFLGVIIWAIIALVNHFT